MINLTELIRFLIGKSCWTKLFSRDTNDLNRLKKIEEGLKTTRERLALIEAAVDAGDLAEAKKLLREEFPFNTE